MDDQRVELEQQIEWLIEQSQDAYFTEYLQGLRTKFRQNTVTPEYVSGEIIRTSRLYTQRLKENMQPQPVQTPQYQQGAYGNVQPVFMPRTAQFAQPVRYIQPAQYVQAAAPKKEGNVEFAIGAGVLGIIGILFVLIAFVLLGITYMNGLAKGISLYGICLLVLLVSELILNKKMPKFAVAITALGISGLYLSTMLNYLYLQNFNSYAAMGTAVAISLFAIFLSRKKDSGTIKIISFAGCYISLFPTGQSFLHYEMLAEPSVRLTHFMVAAGIIFIVNLMTVFLPVKKNKTAINMTHMVLNTFFTIIFSVTALFRLENTLPAQVYIMSSVLSQGLIFFCMERKEGEDDKARTAGNVAAYLSMDVILRLTFGITCSFASNTWNIHAVMGLFLLSGLILFFLFRKSVLKWLQYWLFCSHVLLLYGAAVINKDFYWWSFGMILGVFVLSKLLSRIKILKISELVITLWTACIALYYFREFHPAAAFSLLGVFALSLIIMREWRSLYEEVFICLAEFFVLFQFRNDLTPAIMICILFLGMIGFNYIPYFRDKNTKYYNYVNLGIMGCLYLVAAFIKNHYSYGIIVLLGITFILLMFQERFGMNFKIKNIILILFLCYMVLIWKLPIPIVKSAILMLIAIGAVIAGFILKEKKLRITGLVLTLTVCGKMVLYDFAAAATLEKMLVFLIVGLIALVISGIYVALEKKIV